MFTAIVVAVSLLATAVPEFMDSKVDERRIGGAQQ